MDQPPHPHEEWAKKRHGKDCVDWWWDTPYGPDGNHRHTGPIDDDKRPALLLNTGLTREQYVAGDFLSYIKDAKDATPTDIWTDAWQTNNLYGYGMRFSLCKEDTLPEERDELDRRGFFYLGSRGDCMYFHNPHGELPDMDWLGRIDISYETEGVRLVIQRGRCMCISYHRDHDAFYWSRVAFDGKDIRDPPTAPSPPPPPPPEVLEQQRVERETRRADLKRRADAGDRRAQFIIMLGQIAYDFEQESNKEVLRAITLAKEKTEEWENSLSFTEIIPKK